MTALSVQKRARAPQEYPGLVSREAVTWEACLPFPYDAWRGVLYWFDDNALIVALFDFNATGYVPAWCQRVEWPGKLYA